jgi:hypothetical protein
MRRGKKDANHNDLEAVLRRNGWVPIDTHNVGPSCIGGFPDCLAYRSGNITLWLEFKMPGESLTQAEERFHAEHPGLVNIIETEEQLEKLLTKL